MLSRMRTFLGWLWLAVMLELPLAYGGEVNNSSSRNKKYQVSVCSLFKNEARYLKEWIEYHRIVGVDHFYLYNNGSLDSCTQVLIPYIDAGLVTLVYWPDLFAGFMDDDPGVWPLMTQLPAYENAAKYLAINETEWLITLDVDEFLVPIRAQSIAEVLGEYQEYPGIQVASQHYNAARLSNHDGLLRKKLVIETVELVDEPVQKIERAVEKLIYKPKMHTTYAWPPYHCHFKDDQQAGKAYKSELRINKYVGRPRGFFNFSKMKDRLHVDQRLLNDQEMMLLLRSGFEIEDQERPIYRFLPELLKRMGLETGWGW